MIQIWKQGQGYLTRVEHKFWILMSKRYVGSSFVRFGGMGQKRHYNVSRHWRECCSLLFCAALLTPNAANCQSPQNHGTSPAANRILPSNPQQFFIDPDKEMTLRWSAVNMHDSVLPYQIESYDGTVIKSSEAKVEGGTFSLTVRLSEGFYALRFPQQEESFGVLAQTAYEGKRDPFF